MNDVVNSKSEFRFTGKHMIASMVCFFGVIIAVNLYMATLASKSWTGLIVKNSYVASQEFNGELKKAAEQKNWGWHSTINYAAGTLVLTLRDEDKNIITFDKVVAEIGRPAFEQSDKVIEFMPIASGSNKIMIHLKEGVWALKIRGTAAGKTYRRDLRISVDSGDKGRIL